MTVQHDKEFKEDALRYYDEHTELALKRCAENLGIGYSTLTKWRKEAKDHGEK